MSVNLFTTYFLTFEAWKHDSRFSLSSLKAKVSAGRYCLSVEDVTDQYINAVYYDRCDVGDGAANAQVLSGHFALSADFTEDHPVVRGLIAHGFDGDTTVLEIQAAIECAGEDSDE